MGVDDHDTFTGLTPLQAAAHDGNIQKVIELLDAGADMNIQANGEVRYNASRLHHMYDTNPHPIFVMEHTCEHKHECESLPPPRPASLYHA